jgi:hypothetical protein
MKPCLKRTLAVVACATIGLPCALLIIPAPLSGYWHTPLTDCLCDSKNLLSFQDGVAYQWASGHGEVKKESGRYERGLYWVKWHAKEGVVKVRPGWLLMRIKMPKEMKSIGGMTLWGYRELRPGYIKEVLNTKKKETNKPAPGNAGVAPRLTNDHHWPGVPEPERWPERIPFG